VLTLLIGIAVGFGLAVATGKTEKKLVRLDQVTLTKAELEHVVRAIDLLKDKAPSAAYTRYVADSGSVAFECPTDSACNLEIPARDRVQPRDVEVTVHETAMPSVAVAVTAAPRKNPVGSIYEKLGLMNGDVVTAINGENMASPSETLNRLNAYSERVEQIDNVSIVRNGKPIQISFNHD
jgi:hypothetical protein